MYEKFLPIDNTFLSLSIYQGSILLLAKRSLKEAIKYIANNLSNLEERFGRDIHGKIKIKINLAKNDKSTWEVRIPDKRKEQQQKIREIVQLLRKYYDISSISTLPDKDLLKGFLKNNLLEADLDKMERLYDVFSENYDPETNNIKEEFLKEYLSEKNIGTKIALIAKIKKEFFGEERSSSQKFKRLAEKVIRKIEENLGDDEKALLENKLPLEYPPTLRIGFPEQLLTRVLPEIYPPKKIIRMILERNTCKNLLDMFEKIKENIGNLQLQTFNINSPIFTNIQRKGGGYEVYIHTPAETTKITAPQLLKCDRYTGFSSFEEKLFSESLTLYTSPAVALIFLLGILDSIILKKSLERGKKTYYYFLFFSPEEVAKLVFASDRRSLLEKYISVKKEIIDLLRDLYLKTESEEALISEIILNIRIQELLDQYNLDKVSFILFRIAEEGGQTYKIYEQQYLIIQRNFPFRELVEKYFRHPIELIRRLNNVIKDKNSELWKACRRFWHERGGGESDNAFRAIQGLYRFVVLGDLSGYYQFLREIRNCYEKSKEDSTRNYRKIKEYKKIMKEFGDVV